MEPITPINRKHPLRVRGEVQMKAISHDMTVLRRTNERLEAENRRLREALRGLLASENIVQCPRGMWSTADTANYQLAQRARALLRELGEAA